MSRLGYASLSSPGVGSYGRLVRAPLRSSPRTGDRLTNLEGLGRLSGDDDEPLGTYEDDAVAAESDTDWVGLVKALAQPISSVGVEVAKGAFRQSKLSQGWGGQQIAQFLGMADARADAVRSGTASMPGWGWGAIGVGAAFVLAMVFMLGRR